MTTINHARRLADLLSMERMGPAEFKKAVETKIPKELAYNLDGKVTNARELLQMEGAAASGLIPTEVLATVVQGAEQAKCVRNAFPTYRMNSQVLKVPYGESGSYLSATAEGAEIPIATETYSVTTFTANKFAVRPLISREMVDDASFDVVSQEIMKAGWKIENTLNREMMDAQITGSAGNASTYDTDCGGSGATPLAFLAKGIGTLNARGGMATDIIFHPVCYGAVLSAFTSLATNTGNQATSQGTFGPLFGLNTHICGILSSGNGTATTDWDFSADGNKGALIIDRNAAGAIGMREDIGVEQYSDPVRDLVGMKVKARFDCQQIRATATQWLQY
jgi:hypothetical protein